jgi:hypothetical protein
VPQEPGEPQQPPKLGIEAEPDDVEVLWADMSFVSFVPLHDRQAISSSSEKTMNSLMVPQSSHSYS